MSHLACKSRLDTSPFKDTPIRKPLSSCMNACKRQFTVFKQERVIRVISIYLPLTFYVATSDSKQKVFCSWDWSHLLINSLWNLKNQHETGLREVNLARYPSGHVSLNKQQLRQAVIVISLSSLHLRSAVSQLVECQRLRCCAWP